MTKSPHPIYSSKHEFRACNFVSQGLLNAQERPIVGVPGTCLCPTGEEGIGLALGYVKKI